MHQEMHAMSTAKFVISYLKDISCVLEQVCIEDIVKFLNLIKTAHTDNRRIFIVGNGGSAATASHMANDLLLGTAKNGGHGLRVQALADNIPTLTATANDVDYSEIFSNQLKVLADQNDILIAISVSGNSKNIIRAIEIAKKLGLKSVGFLGADGGSAGKMVDLSIVIPSNGYGQVESIHLILDHLTTEYFCLLQSTSSETDSISS